MERAESSDPTNITMTLPYPHRRKQLQMLLQKLGLTDLSRIRWDLLDRALIHPSISASDNYEQLEFVGDAVARLVAAEFLWEQYPDLPVGEFAAIRSILVSDRILAAIAATYNLDRYLLVGESALNDRQGQQSRLAESFEAILGGLYLSTHNLELIRPWLDAHLQHWTSEIRRDPARQNYKAALQEWSQAHFKLLPEYRVSQLEPAVDADQRFVAEVWLQGEKLGCGKGRSIKTAEQAAAQAAFLTLNPPVREMNA